MPELTRGGVKLSFAEAGRGDPMVFVHGWTCDRTHFAPQLAHFSRTHRCVALDLRGHGESDAPRQEYTIDAFADDVAWCCEQLAVKDAIFVGHSMGGAVALAAAARRPDLVRALVLLDPAILIAAELLPLAAQLSEAFEGAGGMEAVRQYESERFFLESSDRALKERIVAAACRTPQHVVASAFTNLLRFDAEAALVEVSMPLLYVGAEPELSGLTRLRELQPDAVIAKTAGSGHFHQLEVSEQVNAMIERFLTISAA